MCQKRTPGQDEYGLSIIRDVSVELSSIGWQRYILGSQELINLLNLCRRQLGCGFSGDGMEPVGKADFFQSRQQTYKFQPEEDYPLIKEGGRCEDIEVGSCWDILLVANVRHAGPPSPEVSAVMTQPPPCWLVPTTWGLPGKDSAPRWDTSKLKVILLRKLPL